MPASRYPRRGQALAPEALREILQARVPQTVNRNIAKQGIRFSDLDAKAWQRWDSETCRQLAKAVAEQVRRALPGSRKVLGRRVPALPEGVRLEDLKLEIRTFNALAGAGFAKRPDWLGRTTIGSLRHVKGLGAKSLVDLLVSVEATRSELPDSRQPRGRDTKCTPADSQAELFEDAFREKARRLSRLEGAQEIRSDDPRLARALRALGSIGPNAREMGEQIANGPARRKRAAEKLEKALDTVLAKVGGIAGFTLDDELLDLANIGGPMGERNAAMIAAYEGWDGTWDTTLETVGERYELTRERVRQIVERARKRLADKKPFAPALDRALDAVSAALPASADAIEKELVKVGACSKRVRLEGLLTAADWFGRPATFEIVGKGRARLVVPVGGSEVLTRLLREARRSTEHSGATTITELAATVTGADGEALDEDFVERIAELHPDLSWLDRDTGWLWLPATPRNRLVNQMRKALSVCEWLPLRELRAAAARHHRMEGFAPPRRVLLELCRQLAEFTVEGDRVRALPPLDWRNELVGVERNIAQVLSTHGPILAVKELERRCEAAGVNRNSFWIHLGYSPIITRYAREVYGFPGAEVEPGFIESLIPAHRRRSRVLSDYGWTTDGRPWISYKLSEGAINSGVVSVPSAMKDVTQGAFAIRTAKGDDLGTFSVQEARGWGLGPLFRRRGGEPGDHLLIILDRTNNTASVQLSDQPIDDQLLQAAASRAPEIAIASQGTTTPENPAEQPEGAAGL